MPSLGNDDSPYRGRSCCYAWRMDEDLLQIDHWEERERWGNFSFDLLVGSSGTFCGVPCLNGHPIPTEQLFDLEICLFRYSWR